MFRILAIDGGGIRGVIPALFCQKLEALANDASASSARIPLWSLFDLIAGTSTGGILALGIAAGMTATELVDLYQSEGNRIFPAVRRGIGSHLSWFRPKYSQLPLERILKERFVDRGDAEKQMTMSRSLTHVLVTGYDVSGRCIKIWRSWNPNDDMEMWKIARATSAAPTYFIPEEIGEACFMDGGLMANNPAAIAYGEAKSVFDGYKEYTVVSLGTGQSLPPYSGKRVKRWGKAMWAAPVIDCVFDGTSQSTDHLMKCLLPGKKHYRRFQVNIDAKSADLDDARSENILWLASTAKRAVEEREAELKNVVRILNGLEPT